MGSRSDFLRVLQERGFVHQQTDAAGLERAIEAGPLTAYIGFDATADSLHVGSLVQIMMLRWLQKTGNRPVVLLGGGTTKIGDPSGKEESRQLLTDEKIAQNVAGIRRVFDRFLTFGSGPTDAVQMNNAEWLDTLADIPFLRDVGRHFTINRMLTFDSVKLRLEREQPLTFLEFNYMILQAYDFLELFKRTGCRLQMGGSDQWGNIVNGIELTRRIADAEVFGLTTPLITTANGAKMGKTAAGAVWLNVDRVSSWDYWQYWRNTADADVGRFLKLFTELPLGEITRLEALKGAEVNDAKKILATEATRMAHGDAAAREAEETAKKTFEQGGASENLPTLEIPRAELEPGVTLVDLLVRSGLAKSNGEAKRVIQQNGARVNDVVISDIAARVRTSDLSAGGTAKLSSGRKNHALVKAV
jgi:tyrosyl-tRNA synthetase